MTAVEVKEIQSVLPETGHTHAKIRHRPSKSYVAFVIHQNGQERFWVFERWSHDRRRSAHEHLHRWIGLIHLVASLVSVWFPWRCDEHREQWILSVKNHETTSPDTSHCNATHCVLSGCTIRAVWACWIGLERQQILLPLCWHCEERERERKKERLVFFFMASYASVFPSHPLG